MRTRSPEALRERIRQLRLEIKRIQMLLKLAEYEAETAKSRTSPNVDTLLPETKAQQ
jgi:hypothetical protein